MKIFKISYGYFSSVKTLFIFAIIRHFRFPGPGTRMYTVVCTLLNQWWVKYKSKTEPKIIIDAIHHYSKYKTRQLGTLSANQLEDEGTVRVTVNRWRTVVSGTWKYDDPRLNMSHEGAARVWHVQPRVVLFSCPTNDCVSYVLSSDQLNKLFSPLCLQNSVSVVYDLNTQARGLITGVSKTLCDFGHEILLKKSKLVNHRHIPTSCNLLRVPRYRQN